MSDIKGLVGLVGLENWRGNRSVIEYEFAERWYQFASVISYSGMDQHAHDLAIFIGFAPDMLRALAQIESDTFCTLKYWSEVDPQSCLEKGSERRHYCAYCTARATLQDIADAINPKG